ncbi:hypothetical protein [Ktedonospora formicarum]|uniref:MmyB-like transcription regulator ligand binding domain-containing protein n=1 Tax=Ktedonospora formicarum TaxID=2778364 RepID=A0A8J3MUL8_9CHLR|nr:hypothetical protein [Ktedonospora formicarum]GHO46753.1 hypothetical protein KSX_49160 [Ktedonospora formicarum]
MLESDSNIARKLPVIRDVIETIERLRIARQDEVRDCPHPLLKRFTQQELTDEACPTYKNLLVGRSLRVPSRQTLMQIAHYLECSMAQRNELLLAARYLPENLELTGSDLRQVLEQGRQVMDTLPYPALLVTHTLHIEAISGSFQRLFEFLPLSEIPETQRYVLPLFFRHDMPVRKRSSFNDESTKAWEVGVVRGIQLFKQSNRLYQFEPWYQELVERFCAVADFRMYWEQGEILDQHDELPKQLLCRNTITGEWQPIQLKQIRISICSQMYPCLMALLPLDDAARTVFAALNSIETSTTPVVHSF